MLFFPYTILKDKFFYNKAHYIYCAVRTETLNIFRLIVMGVECAMAQAVNRQLITEEVPVQYRTTPCVISGGHSDTATSFSSSTTDAP